MAIPRLTAEAAAARLQQLRQEAERLPPLDRMVALPPEQPLWVFGYGSLLWSPEFPFVEQRRAKLYGFHRRFCLVTYGYRGSPGNPGLILGLDRGGSCEGVAYRIADEARAEVLVQLKQRELPTYAYDPFVLRVGTAPGPLSALAFVIRRNFPNYAGDISLEETADMIASAVGTRGSNYDYLINTTKQLRALGIPLGNLARLERLVEARRRGQKGAE